MDLVNVSLPPSRPNQRFTRLLRPLLPEQTQAVRHLLHEAPDLRVQAILERLCELCEERDNLEALLIQEGHPALTVRCACCGTVLRRSIYHRSKQIACGSSCRTKLHRKSRRAPDPQPRLPYLPRDEEDLGGSVAA